ncbi:MAG: hypothetical protein NTW59_01035 [Candidatus Diapherotrites archaeon]|nr:hypothetical protein [Candidatus Diapherotrites archaeon]
MTTKYSILKFVAVAGTIFSIYNACTERLLLEDIIIIILIAAALVAMDAENTMGKHRKKAEAAHELDKKLEALDEIGEIIHKKLEGTAVN